MKRLGWSAAAYVGYSVVMLVLERGMRKTGGPGIIPFELAGNAERVQEILAAWGEQGRRWARWSLWLDFGYMLTYGTLAMLLIERARSRHGHPVALRLLPIGAVAGDAIEGVALLKALDGVDVDTNARVARSAALAKFAMLAVAHAYLLSAVVRQRS
ncbi:hypothetical protein NM962_10385 [Mycobacterium sp. SVM_VP21]|nr:hypothetical protein NM962_10385 [Mycobacterium sp. SVM_VP21]